MIICIDAGRAESRFLSPPAGLEKLDLMAPSKGDEVSNKSTLDNSHHLSTSTATDKTKFVVANHHMQTSKTTKYLFHTTHEQQRKLSSSVRIAAVTFALIAASMLAAGCSKALQSPDRYHFVSIDVGEVEGAAIARCDLVSGEIVVFHIAKSADHYLNNGPVAFGFGTEEERQALRRLREQETLTNDEMEQFEALSKR